MANNNGVLDQLDIEILAQLHDDGRRSFTEIAENLKVATNTVRNRVNRMIADETLTIVGRLNPNKVGFGAYANIFIAVEPARHIEEVSQQLVALSETSFVAMVFGDFDLMVDIMCIDMNHLNELLTTKIQQIPFVTRTKTITVSKVYKYKQPDPRLLHKRLQSAIFPEES